MEIEECKQPRRSESNAMKMPWPPAETRLYRRLHRRALRQHAHGAACGCDLELRTAHEAARTLGWNHAIVLDRLRQARKELRRWLAVCGITVPARSLGCIPHSAAGPEGRVRLVRRVLALIAGKAPLPNRVAILVDLIGDDADAHAG